MQGKHVAIILAIVCGLLALLYVREYNINMKERQEATHTVEVLQQQTADARKKADHNQEALEKLETRLLEEVEVNRHKLIEAEKIQEIVRDERIKRWSKAPNS